MIEAVLLTMTQNWSLSCEIADKKELLNRSACICDLLFRARTKKNQTPISKHLGVLPNIRRGGNNTKVWLKIAFSEAIIFSFVGVSVNYDGL